jgi:hypothetical protein
MSGHEELIARIDEWLSGQPMDMRPFMSELRDALAAGQKTIIKGLVVDRDRLQAINAKLLAAATSSVRFLEYLSGETDGYFAGAGMPSDALKIVRTAIALASEPQSMRNICGNE